MSGRVLSVLGLLVLVLAAANPAFGAGAQAGDVSLVAPDQYGGNHHQNDDRELGAKEEQAGKRGGDRGRKCGC